jgi:hypothetical protein
VNEQQVQIQVGEIPKPMRETAGLIPNFFGIKSLLQPLRATAEQGVTRLGRK